MTTVNDRIERFCTGCGLCHCIIGTEFNEDEKGFIHPIIDEYSNELFSQVCPMLGKASETFNGDIWGKAHGIWLSWANNENIRKTASSGGVLTSLACYLLKQNLVDGVIQTIADPDNPTKTITVLNKSENDIINSCGSRYSISHPLYDVLSLINKDEKYVFIGKPCDVSALRMYLEVHPEYKSYFPYLMSFFCAGMPSVQAQSKLLECLGETKEKICVKLKYRGDGWPGYTTATFDDGDINRISYQESWRNILGRDVALCCRFCLDGIGECADIACGDAWFINKDGKPLFEEADGRNVLFARTDVGKEICMRAFDDKIINLVDYPNYDKELGASQKYQHDRRVYMKAMIDAMKLTGRPTPLYNKKTLRKYMKGVGFIGRIRRFAGIVKRIHQGKI